MNLQAFVRPIANFRDARCRQAICHLGDMARGHLWRYPPAEKMVERVAGRPDRAEPLVTDIE